MLGMQETHRGVLREREREREREGERLDACVCVRVYAHTGMHAGCLVLSELAPHHRVLEVQHSEW